MPELRIRVRCPHCPNIALLPGSAAGKTVKCSGCSQQFTIENFEYESVQLKCPFCPTTGLANAEAVGREVKCRGCSKTFTVEQWQPPEGPQQDVAVLAFEVNAPPPQPPDSQQANASAPQDPQEVQETPRPSPDQLTECPVCGSPWKRFATKCDSCKWDAEKGKITKSIPLPSVKTAVCLVAVIALIFFAPSLYRTFVKYASRMAGQSADPKESFVSFLKDYRANLQALFDEDYHRKRAKDEDTGVRVQNLTIDEHKVEKANRSKKPYSATATATWKGGYSAKIAFEYQKLNGLERWVPTTASLMKDEKPVRNEMGELTQKLAVGCGSVYWLAYERTRQGLVDPAAENRKTNLRLAVERNLGKLIKACHTFAERPENQGRFPGNPLELYPDYVDDLNVLRHPRYQYEPVSFYYISGSGKKDTIHVIFYEALPKKDAQAKRLVAMGDGTVEYADAEDFEKRIEKTRSSLKERKKLLPPIGIDQPNLDRIVRERREQGL